jgi:hypothetical protein
MEKDLKGLRFRRGALKASGRRQGASPTSPDSTGMKALRRDEGSASENVMPAAANFNSAEIEAFQRPIC